MIKDWSTILHVIKLDSPVDSLEKTLTDKAGDLLIVNTSAFHKATALEQNAKREVFWIYTKFPNFLSTIKKNLLLKKKVQ